MRTLMHRLAWFVAFTAGAAFAAPWQQPAPVPLGDVARQTKTTPKPKARKTITDDDVVHSTATSEASQPAVKPGEVPQPGSATASAPKKTEVTDIGAKASGKDVAAEPGKPTDAQRIAELKKDQESLKSIIKQIEGKIAAETDERRIVTYVEVLGHTRQRLEDNQDELTKLQAQSPAAPLPPQ
jgi:hypothetical protein